MPNLNMRIDTVDKNNTVQGIEQRKFVLEQGKNFRTVHILVFKDEKLILQKLPPDHLRSPNCLGSSVAGYIHAGETLEDAALRKLESELGIIESVHAVKAFSMQDENSTKFISVFMASTNQEIKFDGQEIADVCYLSPDAVSDMVKNSPQLFTKTFLEVYHHCREEFSRAR